MHNTFNLLFGKISITTDKDSYFPGEPIVANVSLNFKKPIKARGIFAELFCCEHYHLKHQREMDRYDHHLEEQLGIPRSTNIKTDLRKTDRIIFKKTIQVAGEGIYSTNSFEVKLPIPDTAQPTSHELGHDNKIHKWFLKVKLDVPFALDKNTEIEIFVKGLTF
jgi:hypothetical protein